MIKKILASRGQPIISEPAKVNPKLTDPASDRVMFTEAVAKLARKDIGKECTFKDLKITGQIRGVMVDKRVNLVYYRILDSDKKVYHKRVTSEDLIITLTD